MPKAKPRSVVPSEMEQAAEVYDDLLSVADGGRPTVVGPYAATTILAMMNDTKYRKRVEDKWWKIYHPEVKRTKEKKHA